MSGGFPDEKIKRGFGRPEKHRLKGTVPRPDEKFRMLSPADRKDLTDDQIA